MSVRTRTATFVVFAAVAIAHRYQAPFTKVEESFNLQAVHDILQYGVKPEALDKYDHVEFPGVVPRTFVGALLLAAVAAPLRLVAEATLGQPLLGLDLQLLVRALLGLFNAAAFAEMAATVGVLNGRLAAAWYVALQATQFHIMYYATRTLPNTFALPVTTIAFALMLRSERHFLKAFSALVAAAVVFRIELVLLLAPLAITRLRPAPHTGVDFMRLFGVGAATLVPVSSMSFVIDSYFWRRPSLPELEGFIYNALQGKSANWGISPIWQYALDVPKLLLNPVTVLSIPVGMLWQSRFNTPLASCAAFVALYSLQPHKEWRFIIYIVPLLTACASIGPAYVMRHARRSTLCMAATAICVASVLASAALSAGMAYASSYNYPGGVALSLLEIPHDARAYLDVKTCMTGATRFLQPQNGTQWTKTEDPALLSSARFWNELDYAVVADKASARGGPWRVQHTVQGYAGIDWRKMKVRLEPQLYVLVRKGSAFDTQHEADAENKREVAPDDWRRHHPVESMA